MFPFYLFDLVSLPQTFSALDPEGWQTDYLVCKYQGCKYQGKEAFLGLQSEQTLESEKRQLD